VIVPNITIVLLVARAAKSDAEVTSAMLSLTLLGLAISTLLQTNVRTGSGFFIPGCPSGIYASVSLSAAATGGLPLVYGMTLMAGLLQMGFSRLITRMRHLFPSEIVGLSVIIVGIELGAIGLQRLSTAGGSGLLVGASTFFVSVFLGVYGRGTWKLNCAVGADGACNRRCPSLWLPRHSYGRLCQARGLPVAP
jgi:NCS2 family nucleobase:cation symporter-2